MKFMLLSSALASVASGLFTQSDLPGPIKGHVTLLQDSKSLKVSFTIQKLSGGVEKGTLVYSKVGMYKIDTPSKLIESDGKLVWTLDKAANTYTEIPASLAATKEFAVWAWAPFFNAEALKGTKEYVSKGSRTLRGSAVSEYTAKMANDKAFTLFLDDKTGVARGAGNTDVIILASGDILVSKDAIDAKEFAFAAPAGATKVEKPAEASYVQVETILKANCLPCHNASNRKAGLSVDTYDGTMKKVTAGDGAGSALYRSVAGPRASMPQGRAPLSKADTDTIKSWIDGGAKN